MSPPLNAECACLRRHRRREISPARDYYEWGIDWRWALISREIASEPLDLAAFDMHPERGFLPAVDPLTRLPDAYDPWEELAQALPALLAAGQIRQAIDRLPTLTGKYLTNRAEYERAMLLLAYFGHAYVYGATPLTNMLPPQIALPWYAVAKQLKRPPVLSYYSHILYNWRRLTPQGPIALENLARLEHFYGGIDEDWFGMIHITIEANAAPGLLALIMAQDGVRDGDVALVARQLAIVTQSIAAMQQVLNRTPEKCDPYIYFNRIRPFLSGWQDNPSLPDGLFYSGVKAYGGQPQFFRGGSGAQSAIIPAMDDALGIAFDDNPFGIYMRSLRDYMPAGHKAFIDLMRKRPAIRGFVIERAHKERELAETYNECIASLASFRLDHLKFAASYIQAQSSKHANSNEVGTGGTPFMPYLKKHIGEVKDFLIP